jgi:hypothetical protein
LACSLRLTSPSELIFRRTKWSIFFLVGTTEMPNFVSCHTVLWLRFKRRLMRKLGYLNGWSARSLVVRSSTNSWKISTYLY